MLKTDQNAGKSPVLCVDLDGTLIRTDLLVETVFALLQRNALYIFLLPLWLLRGKAHLKREIAARVDIDPAGLPYQEEFVAWLRAEKSAGRRLVLTTASHAKFARAVAGHLDLFDDVCATDDGCNLSGARKLERIREIYGDAGFDYAGNSRKDLAIWREAREAILVNPEPGVAGAANRTVRVARSFVDQPSGMAPYLKAMRPHQWVKNALVFVPLLMAHELADLQLLLQACLAFLAFNLCASAVYILNDLFDLSSDRRHPTKRFRPLAAGTLPIFRGLLMAPVLLAGAFAPALWLPWEFTGVLGVYFLLTLAYSTRLKRTIFVDVLVLASLFSLRVIAGGAAVSIPVSFWLLAFSMFIFLSLALVKRYVELSMLTASPYDRAEGRSYLAVDLETLAHFGVVSGYMAVLVLALYVDSSDVKLLYTRPEVIWFLCPLVLYLISRIWLLARRNELHEDPIVFAIKDRRSQITVALGAVLLWAATL